MKTKLKKATVAVVLLSSLSINAYAAIEWAGSQDVEEAKENIVTIRELFNAKNERISSLEQQVESKASADEEALKQAEKDVKELNELLDDVVKENSK